MLNHDLKIGLIGLGSIGQRHAENLQSLGVELSAMRSGKGVKALPKSLRDIHCVNSFSELIDLNLDAIFICNPSNLHSEFVELAINHRIPFFVEKPIGTQYNASKKIGIRLAKSGIKNAVGYMMRYDPCILKMREIIESGKLGEPVSAIIEWGTYLPHWHPWEDYKQGYASRSEMGGGVVKTCSHEIDTAIFLLGPIESAYSSARRSVLEIEAEDCMDALFIHESGVTTLMHLDYFQKIQRRTIDIILSNGRLSWDFHKDKLLCADFKLNKTQVILGGKSINEVYTDMLNDFINLLMGNKSQIPDYFDGLNVLRVCENILKKYRP